jgi:hypothetical protein
MKRRQVLKTGAGIGALGLAGCLGFGGGAGGTESFDTMGEWVPEPGVFDSSLGQYNSLNGDTPAGVAAQIDDSTFEGATQPDLDFANPKASDVDYHVNASASGEEGYSVNFDVYVGDFNHDWTEQNLQNTQNENATTGYQSEGEYQGFTLYANPQPEGGFGGRQTAYGFSSSGYIRVEASDSGENADPDAVAAIEAVIDASEGNVNRYQESNQDMSALVDALPSAHQLSASINAEPPEESNPQNGQLEGLAGQANATTLDGNTIESAEVLVFVSERDVVERDINEYVDESGSFSNYQQRPDVSFDTRTVVIEGTQPLGANLPI